MGDMGDLFNDYRQHKKENRRRNMDRADPRGWTRHTTHHWSRSLLGSRIDYWPSVNKFRWNGRTMHGDVNEFITAAKRKAKTSESAN